MEPELSYPENVIPALRVQFCLMYRERLLREMVFDDQIARVRCRASGCIQILSDAVSVVVVAHGE